MILRRKLVVNVEGPVLTRSNLTGAFGVDAPLARRPDGRPYLPGTLVLGRLAEAYRQLGAAQKAAGKPPTFLSDLRDLFASGDTLDQDGDGKTGRDRRRRVFVSDLVAPVPARAEATRTRIAINPETGSVQRGALQVIEAPHDVGERIVFDGEVRVVAPSAEQAEIEKRLAIALRWIAQWGALRSVGFGVSLGASLEAAQPLATHDFPAAVSERLGIVLTLHDPLCVGERRVAPNIYESGATIPGGVIKGALANLIAIGAGHGAGQPLSSIADKLPASLQALAKHFSALRVLHGIPQSPESAGSRIRRPPHSIVSAAHEGKTQLFDLALSPSPAAACLIDMQAPTYEPDRKPSVATQVDALTGWSEPPLELRVRTQIDPQHRAAMATRLFGVSYRRTDEHVWRGAIDVTAIPASDRPAVLQGLRAALENGLPGIGRGGAFASVSFVEDDSPSLRSADVMHEDGRIVLVLQTPALLRRPTPGASGDVSRDYAAAFDEIGGPELRLEGIFVRERLAGAEFMANRLPEKLGYTPFLLTEPGSTFVFRATDRSAGLALASRWLRAGLRPPPKTLAFYGMDSSDPELWRYLPFLPENGFGEVWSRGPISENEHWAIVPRTPLWEPVGSIEEAVG